MASFAIIKLVRITKLSEQPLNIQRFIVFAKRDYLENGFPHIRLYTVESNFNNWYLHKRSVRGKTCDTEILTEVILREKIIMGITLNVVHMITI